jgi:hypothetical protein
VTVAEAAPLVTVLLTPAATGRPLAVPSNFLTWKVTEPALTVEPTEETVADRCKLVAVEEYVGFDTAAVVVLVVRLPTVSFLELSKDPSKFPVPEYVATTVY